MKAITHSRSIVGTLLLIAACWPLQSFSAADEALPAPAADSADVLAGGTVLDSDLLEQSRGGAELNLYDIKSDGVVRDNQASNLTTGSNYIADGSFAGAAGFATAVQNSGNNVLIQNATIINLQVR